MSESKQPEALRLAAQLRDMSTKFRTPSHEKGVCNGAIQELRRLHALNDELLLALQALADSIRGREGRGLIELNEALTATDAAIAKATNQTN